MLQKIKKLVYPFFNTRAAGAYMLLFAAAIGIATFIENDFGTSAAQKVVYQTRWFELLLIVFSITLLVNIVVFRMIPQKKWSLVLFHASMVIIIIGAGVTRYFGYEGVMHIREGEASNKFLSAETYLQFEVIKGQERYKFSEPVLFASLGNNHWEESYQIGSDLIEVKVEEFIPNPVRTLEESTDGEAIVKIVFGSSSGRQEYFLKEGETKNIRNQVYNFSATEIPDAINIRLDEGLLNIKTNRTLYQTVMATQTKDTLSANMEHPLMFRSLYTDGVHSFVFGDFKESGDVTLVSEGAKVKNESLIGLRCLVSVNGRPQEVYVFGQKGIVGNPAIIRDESLSMAMAYGAKEKEVPFQIHLHDFIMEKYPGTNSAASYASEVSLIDNANSYEIDYRIFMNNILDYQGYRFFQSSFDKDEKGTYLSVNHDFWGTWISYIGYIILTIGLLMTFFSKKTRFYQLSQQLKKVRNSSGIIILVLIMCLDFQPLQSQKVITQDIAAVNKEHAKLFSKAIVQDHKGRMKPMHTLTRELMRKVARKETLYSLNSDQLVLSMFADKKRWLAVPFIKIGKHERLHQLLGVKGDLASYQDFFLQGGAYKLRDEVRRAYSLQPIDRGVFEKELMKVDERINIVSMIFSGSIFRMIPVPGDENNQWISTESQEHGNTGLSNPVADRFFSSYRQEVQQSISSKDYSKPDALLSDLYTYQSEKGEDVMPSKSVIRTEIALNNLNVFNRLALVYSLLGIGFLILLFTSVFKPEWNLWKAYKVLFGLVLLGFLFHTLGLGMRWYVSGRAPWSNGYESMIYIAWTTTLAGILFTRKSFGGLAATMILAATILLVAMLSYLDPEITPLVPVLRSYWLTIHVSLEAGSYGFLMLGAIIGLINLILMMFLTPLNKPRIKRMVLEMTYISEMTLIGGLVMVSIGTYLGGVWANESWGRYWGWDAKETWALVTILVYAFILHMRLIPKMKGLFAFNLATLFGWASVIMTYYGVNYYLSGLHSYAAGDPVPIPQWVYYVVVGVCIIGIIAYYKKRKVGFDKIS